MLWFNIFASPREKICTRHTKQTPISPAAHAERASDAKLLIRKQFLIISNSYSKILKFLTRRRGFRRRQSSRPKGLQRRARRLDRC